MPKKTRTDNEGASGIGRGSLVVPTVGEQKVDRTKFPKAIDAYTNPGTAKPSAGVTGKHADCDQSLDNPDRFEREEVQEATPREGGAREALEKQSISR